jgi:hypothetical protein
MSDPKPFPPVFATNRPDSGETVADEVNRMLRGLREELATPPDLALATAYLNPQGFGLIAEEVEQAPHVRLLLGADPEEPYRSRIERGTDPSFEQAAAHHLEGLRSERDLLGFTVEADAAARRLVAWLRAREAETTPRVEVRRFTKGFLHGKAYIAEHTKMPAVLAGSSNLTFAGLSRNRELNLGYPTGQYTDLVIGWFDELWNESEPFDLAGEYEARWQAHAPWVVFLRMLHELYGRGPVDEDGERVGLPVTGFQYDGIVRASRIMDELGGVLVCDEVGLGKTYIAGEIIRRVSQRDRQKVLIVVPAALKDSTWVPFLKRHDLVSNRVEVVTFDELRIGTSPAVRYLDDYAFVVIDEAHNLRNAAAQRSEAVRDLLQSANPKKVLLLTATPVNNSLLDLHTLISYFVRNDAQFAPIGIPSVADHIASAQRLDPETLSPEHLFDLMDQVAVRRTRRFIKREYSGETIKDNLGRDVPIVFPQPVVERVTYDLDEPADALVEKVIHALAVRDDEDLVIRTGADRDPTRLSLARYAPSVYAVGEDVDRLEITNVGLLRSSLLKRLESSTAALIRTLERLLESHRAFTTGLDAGYVLIGDALREYATSDVDDIAEFLDGLDGRAADQVSDADEYDRDALRADVAGDMALLEEILTEARARHALGPDAKVEALVAVMEQIAAAAQRPDPDGASEGDRRKVIVFSTYTDTVQDLHQRVVAAIAAAPEDSPLAAYRDRVAPPVFGSRGQADQADRAAAIAGFCPRTAGDLDDTGEPRSPDAFDVLITTDVLAEGVNLQQAGRLVSYDLPFNPMKLVQRHGRIDRIGSPHARVRIGVFFPAEHLEEMLRLEEILQRKIAYANAAVGVEEIIPGQMAVATTDVLHHDAREQIMDLYAEKAVLLVDGGASGALSGEEYRRRLAKALRTGVGPEVLGLPFGSGSGFASSRVRRAGYVFCARIADHQSPWFRFVAADPVTWRPVPRSAPEDGVTQAWIDDDVLTCLVAADPGDAPDLPQTLPDAAASGVFDAWAIAQDHIHTRWSELADWANLEPQIEKPLRDAVELVAVSGAFLGDEAQSDLAQRLAGRWDRSVVREVRAIVRDETLDERQKVTALLAYVTEIGLPTPERPEPLPPVHRDDVRVVCWMAVFPTGA